MPDLFLGAAAGPPGLPDWIDHASPDPVKNDPVYLATAVDGAAVRLLQDQTQKKRSTNIDQSWQVYGESIGNQSELIGFSLIFHEFNQKVNGKSQSQWKTHLKRRCVSVPLEAPL